MPIPRLRDYQGPAILSYGFRPFFLLGSLHAGLAILAWLLLLQGRIELPTLLSARDWHVHEMLYGYLPAVITGFLLTAIPNWTGRLPLQGRALLVLVLVWLAGRIAVSVSAWIGWGAAAALDVSFLILVAAAAGREIVAGRNWRNLKVLVLILALLAGNVAFHIEAQAAGAELAVRIGLAATVSMIMLVGGRIVPSFTRNWLARERPGRLPSPFDRFDVLAMILSGVALVLWLAAPVAPLTGAALVTAGAVQMIRMSRWAGDRTFANRLVLVLHVGYAFIPLGFVLVGAAVFGLVPPSAGIHAWSAGAVGVMTLAVMTRASLGHTGRPLVASSATQAIYAAVVVAALARICAAFQPEWSVMLLAIAGLGWAAAFLGFGVAYGPMLLRVRATP